MLFFKKIKLGFKNYCTEKEAPAFGALDIFRYIGPGLLVTVGFIDPGNWAANISAGSLYGYTLLWVVTLSTIMLIVLQHNAAHLGIATGLCISEAATVHLRPVLSRPAILSAVLAAISTALAELLGAAIALNMLFHIPVKAGAVITAIVILILLFLNTYKRIETIIIGFVSIIGLSFVYELSIMKIDWLAAGKGWVTPVLPDGSILLIMSVLGAVVMPHNLFLHSEIIQSRQWNLEDENTIKRQLKFEFLDTLFSMGAGWAINSAMIIIAAATFFVAKVNVNDLAQAKTMLEPLAGSSASIVFAFALLCSGIASSVTAGIAGGSIFAGLFKEPFNIKDKHSRTGVLIVFICALLIIFVLEDIFKGLIISQAVLSVQLPITIFLLIGLTSSKKIMGNHANRTSTKIVLCFFGAVVTALNILLLIEMIRGTV
jgi:manganese transport protein